MGSHLPIAYTISREDGFDLFIALVEAERLLLHEETIPEMLDELTNRIEEDGRLRAPVVVDMETLVVLDGMHRVEALRRLGARFVCVCLVDYRSPEIKVESWCRIVQGNLDPRAAEKIAGHLGLRLAPPASRESLGGEHSLLAFRGPRYELSSPGSGFPSAFEAVKKLELELRARGFEVSYETYARAEEMLAKEEACAILCPPRIGKDQVVERARSGRVFIFKATRHVIPARPLGVDTPLSLLRDSSMSTEEANERLSALLREKRLRHLPPGSEWSGRRYDEDLYVFEDA